MWALVAVADQVGAQGDGALVPGVLPEPAGDVRRASALATGVSLDSGRLVSASHPADGDRPASAHAAHSRVTNLTDRKN